MRESEVITIHSDHIVVFGDLEILDRLFRSIYDVFPFITSVASFGQQVAYDYRTRVVEPPVFLMFLDSLFGQLDRLFGGTRVPQGKTLQIHKLTESVSSRELFTAQIPIRELTGSTLVSQY